MEEKTDPYALGDIFEEVKLSVLKQQRLHRYFAPKLAYLYEAMALDFRWPTDEHKYDFNLEEHKIRNIHWGFGFEEDPKIIVSCSIGNVNFSQSFTKSQWTEIPNEMSCSKY